MVRHYNNFFLLSHPSISSTFLLPPLLFLPSFLLLPTPCFLCSPFHYWKLKPAPKGWEARALLLIYIPRKNLFIGCN